MWVIFALQLVLATATACAHFKDVSHKVGLKYDEGPWTKYGGASIADLDGNGCPDLLLGHHTKGPGTELYFNQCNGTFVRSSFRVFRDVHALTPVRLHASYKSLHFIVSLGGMNGKDPKGSFLIRVREDGSVVNVTARSGLSRLHQRGRGAVPIDMHFRKPWKQNGFVDVLLPSAKVRAVKSPHVALSARPGGWLQRQYLSGDFRNENINYVAAVDAGSDGLMEVLSLHECRLYRVSAKFTLTDISHRVFPNWDSEKPLHGVAAVAEADFNNDLRWDLYLARASTGDLEWLQRGRGHYNASDVLMFGTRDGKYEDVSRTARVPRETQSRGVTAGDFDNDGYVDVVLVQHTGRDIFLMNNGDGTFRARKAPWFKRGSAHGDMATAVDYDGDGRLDLVLSEGDWGRPKYGGYYRVMKNFISLYATDRKGRRRRRNFLLVRVGSSPSKRASSLHAVVHVVAGNLRMMRRVGAPGVAVSVSYIELLHFGLGFARSVKSVRVTWTDGSSLTRWNVKANMRITVGHV